MADACPILEPPQALWVAKLAAIQNAMRDAVEAAVKQAANEAQQELDFPDIGARPPEYKYFASVAHQALYCMLCGADPDNFEGGDARIAAAIIRNSQAIAMRYWGAEPDALQPGTDVHKRPPSSGD